MYSVFPMGAPTNEKNPVRRFASVTVTYDDEAPPATLAVYEDHSETILSKNDSPDVGFRFSVNPYRGCFHACAYCYARPTHEYLSFGAGTDFERKIVVKPRAPELLALAFEKKGWTGEPVIFSGVTDCYQPLENTYKLTRACLEVCARYRNPVGIVTKSPLVERDVDVLRLLAERTEVEVAVSLPFAREAFARKLEPHVTTPVRRLRTIERLSREGIRVAVSVAPVIPGISDEEIPKVLEAARDAGARVAWYVLLRLPHGVKEVFETRLREAFPDRADRVLSLIRKTRSGELYDARFLARGKGEGAYAAMIAQVFEKTRKRLGYEDVRTFRAPSAFSREGARGQMSLF